MLLVCSRVQTRTEVVVAALAGGISLFWLLVPGDLPDQVLRTALVLTTSAFVAITLLGQMSFTHRALAAIGFATAALVLLFIAFGWSWDELHWWVISRRSYESSLAIAPLRSNPSTAAMADEFARVLDRSVKFEADNYAAMLALKILAGLALATALYQRLASHPVGSGLGRFRDFRFSEHLGWGAAVPLIIVLLPGLVRAKVVAFNLLLVTGALYALRGLAVAAFAVTLAGTGPVATALAIVAGFFMLPAVVGIGILLGVLDAGMDLRRRLNTPPARN